MAVSPSQPRRSISRQGLPSAAASSGSWATNRNPPRSITVGPTPTTVGRVVALRLVQLASSPSLVRSSAIAHPARACSCSVVRPSASRVVGSEASTDVGSPNVTIVVQPPVGDRRSAGSAGGRTANADTATTRNCPQATIAAIEKARPGRAASVRAANSTRLRAGRRPRDDSAMRTRASSPASAAKPLGEVNPCAIDEIASAASIGSTMEISLKSNPAAMANGSSAAGPPPPVSLCCCSCDMKTTETTHRGCLSPGHILAQHYVGLN